jgi:type I restriction enzyme S subunit
MKEGWEIKKLGDVCKVIAGQSPEGKFYNTSGKGLPFYQGKKDFGEKFIGTPSTWTTQVTKIARRGDILMSVRAPVGPVNFTDDDVCIGRGLASIQSKDELNSDFLFYQMLSLQSGIAGKAGAVFASISKSEIEELSIAFTNLFEQKRIVGILDKAFEDIATAKANAEKNLKNARELFDSYLNSVFSRRGEGWVENKLIALTSKIGSGATPRGGENAYKSDGISLIRSLNVHDMGFRRHKLAFLDVAQAKGLSNVEVQHRDVLLNITGASVARCCLVPDEVLPARVNQHVSIIRPLPNKLDADFLHYLLISRYYKDQLLQTGAEGGSTRQAITKTQIQNFNVGYPSEMMAQKAIVFKSDEILAETQRLESIYQKKIEALGELKKSILYQAFNGDL